jgi:sugar lactone lactonase YvrE
MRKSILIFLFLFIISSINLFSQVTEEWVKIYNGVGYDNIPVAMVVDSTGSVYVTGYSSTTYGGSSYDYVIVGYNTNGGGLFETRFNGQGGLMDIPNAMCYDGNYLYVTGMSSYNISIIAALTLKLNINGQVVWAKNCIDGGSRVTEGDVISTDNAGNVYVAGMKGGGGWPFYLKIIKYSYAGDTIWVNTYSDRTVDTENPIGMKTDALGNVYVSASCRGNFASTRNITTLKYNTNGQLMWVRLYDSTSILADAFKGISTDQYGNSVIMGYRQVTGGSHVVIIYYDQNGQELRSFLYPSNPGGFYFPKDIYLES